MKKLTAIVSAAIFLVSLDACIMKSNVRSSPGALAGASPYKQIVQAVQKKTGERLTFPAGRRATIYGDKVLVPDSLDPMAIVSLRTQLRLEDIQDIEEDAKGQINAVATKDGRFFRVVRAVRNDQGVEILASRNYRFIPLSELDLVWVKKTNWPLTLVASSAVVGVIALAALSSGSHREYTPPPEESCPFVYSFDGQDYVLDAEPYGGSVCSGLERADWIGLDNLRPVDGRYRLLLTNELDEVEHVDELKLVVVDHPTGVSVVPDLSGRVRTVASPLPPLRARDAQGRDILPLLDAKDETFWLGRVEGRDPEKTADLKDELVLEFAKPAGVRQAKLVANAWTTRWGSQAIRPLLAARGSELRPYFEKVNAGGPALLSLLGWFAGEEMYNLQVRVETEAGWKTKALIFGGGPFIAKDKVYELDLGDVRGDTVRIKLTPAAGFWMIDRLALDFSVDVPIRVNELAAVSARDGAGRDVGEELASDDNAYFVIPKDSGPATMEFAVPPGSSGMSRSIFIKARGYYDVLLDANGEPGFDVDEMINTPGESLRFLLKSHPALSRPTPTVH